MKTPSRRTAMPSLLSVGFVALGERIDIIPLSQERGPNALMGTFLAANHRPTNQEVPKCFSSSWSSFRLPRIRGRVVWSDQVEFVFSKQIRCNQESDKFLTGPQKAPGHIVT